MYSVLKKVLEYRYPLYRSTGTRFKKLFLSIVFTILKKSYFLNIQPVYLGFVCDLPPGPDVSQTKKNISEGCLYFFLSVIRQGLAVKGRKNNFSGEKAQTNAYGLYVSKTTSLNRIPILKNVLLRVHKNAAPPPAFTRAQKRTRTLE